MLGKYEAERTGRAGNSSVGGEGMKESNKKKQSQKIKNSV